MAAGQGTPPRICEDSYPTCISMESYTAKIKLLHCEMEKIFTSSYSASLSGAVLSTRLPLRNEHLNTVQLCLTRSTMQQSLLLTNHLYYAYWCWVLWWTGDVCTLGAQRKVQGWNWQLRHFMNEVIMEYFSIIRFFTLQVNDTCHFKNGLKTLNHPMPGNT